MGFLFGFLFGLGFFVGFFVILFDIIYLYYFVVIEIFNCTFLFMWFKTFLAVCGCFTTKAV